ncbi:Mitogen-activated protein kinase kinase kinase [Musa troglodytarum]|uniref:Mitogen-activated protein kinase kinase kinase n=1 Tax=Musa troglodytarum TaxID=320322 RepID=A0A9E7FNR0_9LILI|nr:Mitogen-activated protein kinase kinase kinase [Musa troglodytarum]
MEWTRGAVVGRGSFGTVSLAFVRGEDEHRQLPPLMAVKSAPLPRGAFLREEKAVLSDLQDCPHVVRCFGEEVAPDAATGTPTYNLFLEFVAGGTLHDLLRRSGGSLRESVVRRYARSILRGLDCVHSRGYAHCDVKLQNILVDRRGGDVKIADFGLAQRIGDKIHGGAGAGIRGTPLYMSPESAARGECGAPADIWSLGCAVAEMVSGRPAWGSPGGGDAWELLYRIGFGDQLPEIPSEMSSEGKDFLRRCFVKDPAERWTAEMLLQHPFVALNDDLVDDSAEAAAVDGKRCRVTDASPRSVLGLSQWSSSSRSPSCSTDWGLMESVAAEGPASCVLPAAAGRVRDLANTQLPDWSSCSSSDGWIEVRDCDVNSVTEEARHDDAQETKLDSMPTLEEMVSRHGCRPARADVLLESTVQLALPSSIQQHEDRMECGSDSTEILGSEVDGGCSRSSLCLIGGANMCSFCSLTAKDCKVVPNLNEYKHRDV